LAESPTPSEQAHESSAQLPEHMTVKRFGTPPPKIDHKLDRDIFKSALSSNCQKRQSADATNVAQSGKLD